ncbi:unnamed protein product, partial [Didymodactylos carnosus]
SNENIYIEKQFNRNFNENDFKKICIDYQINPNHMKEYLRKINFINEQKLKKYIEDIQMPDREQFWQLMMKQGIITNIKSFILINIQETNNSNSKLKKFIDTLGEELKPIHEIKPNDKSIVFFGKVKFDAENMKYVYRSLAKNYQILEESIEQFESITSDAFLEIEGLDINDSKELYNKLVEQKIIDKQTGTLLTTDLQKLNFDKYQIYDQRIITIINCRCLYKLQILEILQQIEFQDFDSIHLTLPYNLHKDLLLDFESSLIIKPVYYNYKKINVSFCEKFLTRDYSYKLEQLIKTTCNNEETICKSIAK